MIKLLPLHTSSMKLFAMKELENILLVGLGGFAGSVLRYLIARATALAAIGWAMTATLTANLVGSLVIGILFSLLEKNHSLWMFFVVGMCGGFTTFSTFSLETVTLFKEGAMNEALLYIGLSLIGCGAATWGGIEIGRLLH